MALSFMFCLLSTQLVTIVSQLKSPELMKSIPALDTVAGVASFRLSTSNRSFISGVRAILSLLARVRTLLSSMTVLRDSTH